MEGEITTTNVLFWNLNKLGKYLMTKFSNIRLDFKSQENTPTTVDVPF